VKLVRQVKRIAGTASVAMEMAGRLAFLRALEDEPDLRSRATVLHQVARLLLQLHTIEVRESGQRPPRPALIVSNHVNYLDPLVILSRVPALPLAKEEVRRWPVIGTLCEHSGVQFVGRQRVESRASALRTMVRTLAMGASIINFPEGTTSDGSRVLPFKPSGFGAARIAKVPVVPAAIVWESPELSWTGDASFVPHYLGVAGRERITVHLRWGEALSAADADVSHRAQDFLSRTIEEKPNAAAECA
jgi:1-acyl-sn-glycerol-3-phosphate acyltransferase